MELTQHDVVEVAEELLSRRFGGAHQLTEIEELHGSGHAMVLRARVSNSPFLPHRSVVIKFNPATGHPIDDAALVREVVAYQFTTSLAEDVRPGPVMLAYDMAKRIVVLTDVGEGDTLAEVLVDAPGDARRQILRALGSKLGLLHAGTAERESDFDVLLKRQLRAHPQYAQHQALRDEALHNSLLYGLEIMAAAGLPAPQPVVTMAHNAAASLLSGNDRAFTPFDLSPDNIIVSKQIHLLDYEWAGFRNVGFDVASVVAGFPQFLFTQPITDDEADVFISAWAREVQEVWPRFAQDDPQHRLVTTSLVGWALSSATTLCAGGIEGLVALLEDDGGFDREFAIQLLRPADEGPFSEDELLIRRDLYETFEALGRYAARCGTSECDEIAAYSTSVAERLTPPDAREP